MKVYRIIGAGSADSMWGYPHEGNEYYIYDPSDGSVELWSGDDLLKISKDIPAMSLRRMYLQRGDCISKQDELILASNGIQAYIWYKGVGTVWEIAFATGEICVESLNPIRLGRADQLEKYKVSYGSMMRRVAMEVL